MGGWSGDVVSWMLTPELSSGSNMHLKVLVQSGVLMLDGGPESTLFLTDQSKARATTL